MDQNGWITSVSGSIDASLPDELQARGYDLTATGDGERIVPTAISERFCKRADGQVKPVTSGSTRAVALTVMHAGIAKVKRNSFDLP